MGFQFFSTRRFFPLFGTQFLGAFNDNLLKTAIIVMASYHGLTLNGMSPALVVNLAAGLFILPFFLFSATAGKVSERYDKAIVAQWVKKAEIAIMAIGGAGFYLQHASLLLLALFLMGVHSTFFGPLKYSVLPQYLKPEELVAGNGLIEMGTFMAILIGQIMGSLLVQSSVTLLVLSLVAVALLGWGFSRNMPSATPGAPDLKLSFNFIKDSVQLVGKSWKHHDIKTAILGISWFWLVGAIYTTQLPTFTRIHLGGDADVYTLLLALFSIGIGAGSVFCARLSHSGLKLGLVWIGSLGMTVFGGDLALGHMDTYHGTLVPISQFLTQLGNWRSVVDVTLLGLFGGFFTVPLYTWLQTSSSDTFRSQAIAANNIINGFYMVGSVILSVLLLKAFNSIAILLLITAGANILATGHLMWVAPTLWQRRFDWRQ